MCVMIGDTYRSIWVSLDQLQCQCLLHRTAPLPPNSTASHRRCRPSGRHRLLARVFTRGRRWPTDIIHSRARRTTRRWRHRWPEVGRWRQSAAESALVMGRAAVLRCTVTRTAVAGCRRRPVLWHLLMCYLRVLVPLQQYQQVMILVRVLQYYSVIRRQTILAHYAFVRTNRRAIAMMFVHLSVRPSVRNGHASWSHSAH